ncbi:MAG: hypothetical protein ABIG44_05305 [Planctomycetota bacterium]
MACNGSPTTGTDTPTEGGSPTPSPQPVQPARCTAPGTTRATLVRGALRVWLQAVDPLNADCNDANIIAGGIEARLQSLFTLVARRPGQPQRIQVLWTTDVSTQTIGERDIIIYFTNWYAAGGQRRSNNGVVNRYLQERASATSSDRSLSQAYQQLRRQHITNNTTPSEGGLCVPDTDGPDARRSTSVSEVFTDIMRAAIPADPAATNYRPDLLRNRVGFGIAGMAFHEAMHNKIDPFKTEWGERQSPPRTWDLHSQGGGGLAVGNFGWDQAHTSANINLMGQYIYRRRRQYILQPSQAASPSPSPGTGGTP